MPVRLDHELTSHKAIQNWKQTRSDAGIRRARPANPQVTRLVIGAACRTLACARLVDRQRLVYAGAHDRPQIMHTRIRHDMVDCALHSGAAASLRDIRLADGRG